MSLAEQLSRQLEDPKLDQEERARLRCRIAGELEEAGDYEAARQAMGDLWRRVGEYPKLDALDEVTRAEVLLRAGTLTGWIGRAQQIKGAQEFAKDLIGKSSALFEKIGFKDKVAESRINLAVCYWREGGFDEARVLFKEALSLLSDEHGELKARALLNSTLVEVSSNRYHEALALLGAAAPLFEVSNNHAAKGRFHIQLALVLKKLGETEHRGDYTDRALLEYVAASFHLEQAGHTRYLALVENNLGSLLSINGRHKEAQQHLDRARRIFISLKDSGSVAQVDDTRARAFLAQGRNAEAERVVRASVSILENGDEYALLAEALTTHGTALARLGRYEEARRTLRCASEAAARAGDIEGAGRAELTLIEELDTHLNAEKMRAIYESADQLLANSRSPETLARLRRCARRVLAAERDRVKGFSAPNFIYAAGRTAALLRESHRIATTNQTVLITGETGTGKELLARMIHEWSGRAGEFVVINCAALTDTLIEAQLFGHVKGSSTDVAEDRPGALRADGGTLFLDEVADLSDHNQVKLLRLIEYGEIHPVGAPVPERMDVRIIAATNHNLREEMTEGRFRADLFYRLQAFHLEIPPLRERPEDISLIARQFIKEAKEQQEKHVMFTDEALETMRRLPLRGNVRELRSLIERAVVEADDGDLVTPEAIETVALRQTRRTGFANPWAVCSLEEEVLRFEADLIKRALEMAKGSITHAARLLGITHQGLAFILNGRHKNLLAARIPAKRRKRSVIGTSRRKGS